MVILIYSLPLLISAMCVEKAVFDGDLLLAAFWLFYQISLIVILDVAFLEVLSHDPSQKDSLSSLSATATLYDSESFALRTRRCKRVLVSEAESGAGRGEWVWRLHVERCVAEWMHLAVKCVPTACVRP